jgi:hypothetical protein
VRIQVPTDIGDVGLRDAEHVVEALRPAEVLDQREHAQRQPTSAPSAAGAAQHGPVREVRPGRQQRRPGGDAAQEQVRRDVVLPRRGLDDGRP